MVCGNPPTLDTRLDPSPRARLPLLRAPLPSAHQQCSEHAMHQAGAARGSPPGSLRPRFHPASPCNVSERSFPARLPFWPFIRALLEHVVHRGGCAGTQLLTPFRTVHLHTHIHEHTACPVYVCILCVHGNFSCCTGVVCIIGLLGRTHSLPIYVLIRSDLLCKGAAHLHHHSLFVMLCTNNCHVCWKLKHNSLPPISLCAW